MKRVPAIVLILLCSAVQCLPQSMNSLKGMYTIPTAEIPKDGEVAIGSFFLRKEYFDGLASDFRVNTWEYFGSIAFLPFLETSLRLSKPDGGGHAIGDRMISLKLQVLQETESWPSFTVGAQDFFHSREILTNKFNSTYIVATKNLPWSSDVSVKATAGYGFKAMNAVAYQFIGFFGGVSAELFRTVELIGEYDALNVNGAVRLDLLNHIRLLGGIVKGKYFSGGASCYFEL